MDKTIQDKIISLYLNGTSISGISKELNIGYSRIYRLLINLNYKKVNHPKIGDEKYNQVTQCIKDGMTISEISNYLSIDKTTISIIAKNNNFTINKVKPKRSEKNINYKDDYFHIIDTEEKAYFLGLIYTDGNVRIHNGGYLLSIEIQASDDYILKKLSTELNCNNKLYYRKRKTQFGECNMVCFTSCNSKQMFDDLSRFDIIPNKTYKSNSFKNINELIPKELHKHFLRGLIDGDGTISNRNTCNKQHNIGIIHMNTMFCDNFDNLLKNAMHNNNLHNNIIWEEKSHVYNLRYRRINDVKEICYFLYHDANICLLRKQERASLYFTD